MHYGLDIGGTKMELAIFDEHFDCLEKERCITPVADYPAFIARVTELVVQADARYSRRGSLGIGLPGVVTGEGRALSSNVPCLTGQRVGADLTHALKRPVAIGNDCRCFALSEARLGAGKGIERVLGIILGTGLGGGLCINGQLYAPDSQLAGEFGHLGLHPAVLQRWSLPLLPCGCGLTGCAETYVSGAGLARLYELFGQLDADTYVWLEHFRQGRSAAVRTFECFMDALGAVIAGQILVLDPGMLVLGGGLSAIDEIRQGLPDAVRGHLFENSAIPPIVLAEGGPASGVRGAALMGAKPMESQ
ncbi:ROK family protein [Bowmanella dokdonensis]|uniref:N-acetylglucosamine kinase n=1 Tax=Bowmanella dokdonensis TaxID=751969 RepID=A0A939DSY7_9ALTE|nr:ROK family protein [Bowmanella dokdonensis]MBN7827620.1 ROK family protein [Bowmanella dokdonensis]